MMYGGMLFPASYLADQEEDSNAEARERWEEENCDCEVMGGRAPEWACVVHGDPEAVGR